MSCICSSLHSHARTILNHIQASNPCIFRPTYDPTAALVFYPFFLLYLAIVYQQFLIDLIFSDSLVLSAKQWWPHITFVCFLRPVREGPTFEYPLTRCFSVQSSLNAPHVHHIGLIFRYTRFSFDFFILNNKTTSHSIRFEISESLLYDIIIYDFPLGISDSL